MRILVLCSFLLDKMHHFSWTFGEALDIDKLGGTGYLDPRPMRLTEPRNGGGGRDLCFPLPPRAGCPAPHAGSFGRTPRKSPPSSAACARAAARHSTNEALSDVQTGCAAQLQFTSLCLVLSPSEKYCLSVLSRNS